VTWLLFRAYWSRRWRAWIVIALLAGVGVGAVLALFAGAQRTQTAYPRLVEEHDAADFLIIRGIPGLFDFAEIDLEAVADLPQVVDSAQIEVPLVLMQSEEGRLINPGQVTTAGSFEGFGEDISRLKIVEGRLADQARPEEVVVSFEAAESLELEVGEELRARYFSFETAGEVFGSDPAAFLEDHGETLRVVGIAAQPVDFPPFSQTQNVPLMHLTRTALEDHPEGRDYGRVRAVVVRVDDAPGARREFLAAMEDLAGGVAPGIVDTEIHTAAVQATIDPVARAVRLGGGLAALGVILVVAQACSRQFTADRDLDGTFSDLGITRPQLFAVKAIQGGATAATAVVVAILVAWLASDAFPIGVARTAEPSPGLRFETSVLLLGALVAFVLLLVVALPVAWSTARRQQGGGAAAGTPRSAVAVAGAAGLPAPAVAGLTIALRPRTSARDGVPLRTTLSGMVVAVLSVSGAMVVASSFDHLTDTPALYGWTHDLRIGHDFASELTPEAQQALIDDPDTEQVALGEDLTVEIAGQRIVVRGVTNGEGELRPALLEGRAPAEADELVLGADRLSGVGIGDDVEVTFRDQVVTFGVVGRAVLPEGEALMTFEGVRGLAPESPAGIALVGLREGVDPVEFRSGSLDYLGLSLSDPDQPFDQDDTFGRPELPEKLEAVTGAERGLRVIAGLLGLAAVGALLQILLTTVRRRARDLALLKTLGFRRGQLLATVACQAGVLVVITLILGLPLGVALGRWLWTLFADQLGVIAEPTVPVPALVLFAVGAVVVANLVALIPARRAARVSVVRSLRTE
jgi:hypothetical protein